MADGAESGAVEAAPASGSAAEIERAALQTLDELELVPALDSFRGDFEKLVRSMRRARDGEREAAEHVSQLRMDLDTKRRAKEGAEQERADLDGAKKQLEAEVSGIDQEIKRLLESAESAKDGIQACKDKISELDAVIAEGSGWTEAQTREKEKLETEEERQQSLLLARKEQGAQVQREVDSLRDHVRERQDQRQQLRQEMVDVSEETEKLKRDTRRLQGKKDEAEAAMKQTQEEAEALGRRVREALAEAEDAESAAAKEQASVKAARDKMEHLIGVYDRLQADVGKLTAELDTEGRANEAVAKELVDLDGRLRERQTELEAVEKSTDRLRLKHGKASRMIDKEAAKHADVIKQELALREERDAVLAEDAQVVAATKALERELEKRRQERELLRKAISSEADASGVIDRLITEHASSSSTLRAECRAYRDAVGGLRDRIDSLREERARIAVQAEAASERYVRVAGETKQTELKAGQTQRRLLDLRAKVRSQEHLLESVRADKTTYTKTLRVAERDMEAMRRQFQDKTYRIAQLKDELMAKDHRLVREHFEFKKTEKESERVAADLATLQNRARNADDLLAAQEAEVVKLQRIVKEAEDERSRQKKELAAVLGERDVLQSQLVKRDEELAALYEKLKVQKSALARGASQYSAKQSEHEEERERIEQLQAEAEHAQAQVMSLGELRREMNRLEVALDKERSKIRSLTEEVARPLNVHRWRAMKVVDPERFKLIQRGQSLQRRLLEADGKVTERDEAIRAQEKLYVETREALARQPGAEVDEETAALKEDLKGKVKQLRALEEERETYKALVDEIERDMERLRTRKADADRAFARRTLRERRLGVTVVEEGRDEDGVEVKEEDDAEEDEEDEEDERYRGAAAAAAAVGV